MSHVIEEPHAELHAATAWKAGALAGLIAGVVFLMLEMALVWMVQGMSPWGPPYMMAAMVLGADILPAMGTWAVFDHKIVMIHFPMAAIYGLLGAWLIHRFDLAVAVMIGAGLGLAVYGVFVINSDGSNAPFARPDLAGLAKGLKFIRDNDYPIRGRLAA